MVSRAERHRREKQAAAAKQGASPKRKRAKAEVLSGVTETLQMVELGLADLLGQEPPRRMPGLRNVVVFGHATTQALQNLRSTDPSFDAWYQPKQEEMRADPLMKFFWDLRSEILKEGSTGNIGMNYYVGRADQETLGPIMNNPPPNATTFFMGDSTGGSGWRVRLPDGTIESYYVDLPESVGVEYSHHFRDAPAEHNGQPLTTNSVQSLAPLYVDYLRNLVREAVQRFG